MKPRVILLLTAEPDVERAVEEAALASRHELRVVGRADAAFLFLHDHLDDIDLIIFDLDSGMHHGILLAAIEAYRNDAPILLLMTLETASTLPHGVAKGQVEYLGKPVTAARLTELIHRLAGPFTGAEE